jgi:hypothetical protein
MPIDYKKYPADWHKVSRTIRNERSGRRCERCGVRQYGIGYWKDDVFTYAAGNIYYDDFQYTVSYSEAREAADHCNEWCDQEPRYIVIVLTVAHQCECNPVCSNPDHLLALCQRCHLRQDAKMHAANAQLTRAKKRDAQRALLTSVE